MAKRRVDWLVLMASSLMTLAPLSLLHGQGGSEGVATSEEDSAPGKSRAIAIAGAALGLHPDACGVLPYTDPDALSATFKVRRGSSAGDARLAALPEWFASSVRTLSDSYQSMEREQRFGLRPWQRWEMLCHGGPQSLFYSDITMGRLDSLAFAPGWRCPEPPGVSDELMVLYASLDPATRELVNATLTRAELGDFRRAPTPADWGNRPGARQAVVLRLSE